MDINFEKYISMQLILAYLELETVPRVWGWRFFIGIIFYYLDCLANRLCPGGYNDGLLVGMSQEEKTSVQCSLYTPDNLTILTEQWCMGV